MTITYNVEAWRPVKRILASWVSDGDGDASGTTKVISGYLLRGVTDPGTTAPTDDYDIVLTDDEGADILGNCLDDLMDRDTADTEIVDFVIYDGQATMAERPCVSSAITITVSNAGDTKEGQVILYFDGQMAQSP